MNDNTNFEAWKIQAMEYCKHTSAEFLVSAQRRTPHPGKRQNWKTKHRNFVYKPAICRLGFHDIRHCGEILDPYYFVDKTSFIVHQLEGKKPVAYVVRFDDLAEASWESVVRDELLQWTPLPEAVIDHVLKGFLMVPGTGELPLFPGLV